MIFGNLINLGVKSEMDFYQKREARIVNLFALIILSGLLIGTSTVLFISGDYMLSTVLFTTIAGLSILFFNYKAHYNIATFVFVITINLTIFVLNQQYIDAVGNYLYYFPVIFCVALIHNPIKSNARTAVFFLIVLVSFLCSRFIDIPSLKNTTITEKDSAALLSYNSVLAFFITLILVYLVVKLINQQNKEVLDLLAKERKSQIIITQSLKEKEVLLAEIHHRVKNNLAVISGLLNLQMESAQHDESKKILIDARNRVMSIAMVHQKLYKNDLSKVNFKSYVSELVNEIIRSHPLSTKIKIIEDLDVLEVDVSRAVPIGLIINEIITNSLKHAFNNDNNEPIITIKMKQLFDKVHFLVSDNGIGFKDLENRKDTSLGITLIESLIDQVDAHITFKNDNGSCVSFVVPF